ncbi:unnamed protein product [Orchesella dallaii]|uniref:DNA replication ATP-dependent helicase/nuclease n=1 Tax=Orchesella dallaii TaxID=48710 RepID=A0ABP1RKR7_9HEXA
MKKCDKLPIPSPGKRPRVKTPPKSNPKSKFNCNTSNKGVTSNAITQGASHGSKRIKMGLYAKNDPLRGSTSSPDMLPTLHARTLNNEQQTVKGLYVDGQQRYVVERRISKIQNKSVVVVTYQIKAEASDEQRKLVLKDMWAEIDWMSPGTLVNIVGVSADENQCFIVERMNGYLIVEPDRLMSVTSVVTQMYCERKAALSRFISGGGDNAIMYRGVVAHELICKAMTDKLDSIPVLKKEAKNICRRPQMLERAYGIGMTDEELEKLQTSAAEWVSRFMTMRFFGNATSFRSQDPKHQNFHFDELLGVEDNIWSPTYGLKGKIDATVLIKKDGKKKTVPLEFKTGSTKSQKRQAIKADHVGQVSLYTLMMGVKYGEIEDAMLYYISDDSLSLHPPRTLELQQLIMKRNKLIRSIGLSDGDLPYLPRPDGIDYEFKCKTCEVRNICTLQIRKKNIPENELLRTEKDLLANCKLSDEEFQFFEQWFKVITAETEEVEKRYNDKNLWTVAPEAREAAGTCVANLTIVGDSVAWVDSSDKPGFLQSFEQTETSSQSLISLRVNDFVALSSNVEVCINYGVIVAIRDNEITLSLDQALHREYKTGNFTYAIDKINTTSPIASQYSYLMKLMEDSPEAERLRQYIIMKKQPKYRKLQLPDAQLQEIVKDLNAEQMRIIWKSTVSDSFLFVKGTPGSGKTASIVRLLRALVHAQKTVLVVSYTGMALEHILKKFQDHYKNFIKISSSSAADACLRPYTTKEVSKAADSIASLTELYNKPVVGTTLLSLKHPIFQVRRFDFCIIDEASQALPTAVFGALTVCDKYVVFGDPNQLPPVIQSSIVKNLNICDNFFSLMASPVSTIKLNTQYRMNAGITKLANDLIYENQMKCADRALEKRYLRLAEVDIRKVLMEEVESTAARNLLCHVVSKKFEKAAVFVDTSDVPALESRVEESICNEAEVLLTMSFVHLFIWSGLCPSTLGIVAPFRGQVDLLRKALKSFNFGEVEVNTVDQYQGREKEVIICTFTKSLQKDSPFFLSTVGDKKEGILEDMRRLNVAITRARSKVVLLGNRHTLKEYSPFKKLFEVMSEVQIRKLTKEEHEGLNLYANRMKEVESSTTSLQV